MSVDSLVLAALLLAGAPSFAADRTAASCSSAHVQTALNSAQAGDRVLIPACPAGVAWTTPVTWSAPANVSVFGAGNLSTQGGGDQTVFIDNVASGSPMLTITPNASGAFRLAGITLRGGSGLIKEGGILSIGGSSTQARFDHLHINKSTYSPGNNGKFIVVNGMLRGVMDHILLTAGTEISWIHFVNGQGVGEGDGPWTQPTGFGGADFMYVEDSRIVAARSGVSPPRPAFSDCHTAGKFVIRFSTGLNANFGQTHPTGHATNDRGCRAFELYQNTVTSDGTGSQEPNFAFSYNNSGPQLMWGNTVGGVFKNIIYLNICRQDSACGYNPPYGGWGVCGQSSPWDENQSGQSGYACIDQPGRGQGDLLQGLFPNKVNAAFGVPKWPRQLLEPIYEWMTTGDTVSGWGGNWLANGAAPQVTLNRDLFMHHNNGGCNAGAASCATGVGVGTLAQRPTNCALNVAWWATDAGGNWHTTNGSSNDGALYRCTAPNTWALYYTPYTYPHPLVVSAPAVLPGPPTDVVLTQLH